VEGMFDVDGKGVFHAKNDFRCTVIFSSETNYFRWFFVQVKGFSSWKECSTYTAKVFFMQKRFSLHSNFLQLEQLFPLVFRPSERLFVVEGMFDVDGKGVFHAKNDFRCTVIFSSEKNYFRWFFIQVKGFSS